MKDLWMPFVAALLFLVGFTCGVWTAFDAAKDSALQQFRKAAVDARLADWRVIDEATGKTEFRRRRREQ